MAKRTMSASLDGVTPQTGKVAVMQTESMNKVGLAIGALNKRYGKVLLRTGKDIPYIYKMPYNEPVLDYVADGGIPIARFTEFLGENHSGKTRNGLKQMGNFQKYCFGCHTPNTLKATWKKLTKDGEMPELLACECSNCNNPITNIQAMVDIEGTTDPVFMRHFGIDVDGVLYTRPDMPSQAVGIIDVLLRQSGIGLILLDSIGSMGSDKEVETAIEDEKMNQNALFFNKALRKWQMALNSNTNEAGIENGTTMIVVNQSYVTLSLYSTEVPQGGRGLKHGKSMSLKTRIKEKTMNAEKTRTLGVHVEYKNEKNKSGVPYRVMDYYLNLDSTNPDIGYCQTNILLQYIELAIAFGIVNQSGGWFKFNGKTWQGKVKLIEDFDDEIKIAVDKIVYNKEN